MKKETKLKRKRHCVFNLHVHLVFVTKYRRKIFTKEMLADLHVIFKNVCLNFEAECVEFDGESDHIHLLINYPPKVSISTLVNSLKGVSSRMLKQKKSLMRQRKLWSNSLWSPSYFASSCGGAPINIIRQYIQQQNTPT